MNETQTAILLALAHGHDQRHGTDDIKVQAWYSLFEQEAPAMEYEWAVSQVNWYYARTTDMLMPAHLVKAWRAHRGREAEKYALTPGTGTPMPEWFKDAYLRRSDDKAENARIDSP
jgi:arylsulfatase A-like enzyme